MSKNDNTASGAASEEHQNASVLDILYCDTHRVGAFLSQFDELGVATSVTVSESIQRAHSRAAKLSTSGGIPGLLNANLSVDQGPTTQSGQQGEARNYDPLWANALALLDYLDSNDLIKRDLDQAKIGQFVLSTGAMSIIDYGLFKDLWSDEAFKGVMRAQLNEPSETGSQSQQERRKKQHQIKEKQNKDDFSMSLVKMFPHVTQARITIPQTNETVWSSLRNDSLTIPPADLVLKHGIVVAGEWSMIGILDALPDVDASGNVNEHGFMSALSAGAAALNNPYSELMFSLLPTMRPFLGRPFTDFGMTPLLIYRKIDQG